MLIRLNLQPRSWNRKPSSDEVKNYIKPFIHNHTCSITPEELITAIERGQTFTPGVLTGSKAFTWQNQQILCADIDNGYHITETAADGSQHKKFVPVSDPITPDEALEVMAVYNIEPYFMYHSFSHNTEGKEYGVDKFRIVVILDRPITDASLMKSFNERFAAIFNDRKSGVADEGVHNLDRLYFGSVPGSVFYTARNITSLSSLELLPKLQQVPIIRKADNSKTSRRTSVKSNSGKFDLLECLDYISADDRKQWINVGIALKYEGYSASDWDSWSQSSDKYKPGECYEKWDGLNTNPDGGPYGPITGAYITKLAKQGGYIPPSKRPHYKPTGKVFSFDDFLIE